MFGAYAAGSATLLLSLAVFAAFTSGLINRFLRQLLPHVNRIAGAVLVLSGGYLLLFWLPQQLGGRPGTGGLTGVAATLSTWISEHQLAITVTALGIILITAGAALTARATNHTTDTAENCCAPTAAPADGVDNVEAPKN